MEIIVAIIAAVAIGLLTSFMSAYFHQKKKYYGKLIVLEGEGLLPEFYVELNPEDYKRLGNANVIQLKVVHNKYRKESVK